MKEKEVMKVVKGLEVEPEPEKPPKRPPKKKPAKPPSTDEQMEAVGLMKVIEMTCEGLPLFKKEKCEGLMILYAKGIDEELIYNENLVKHAKEQGIEWTNHSETDNDYKEIEGKMGWEKVEKIRTDAVAQAKTEFENALSKFSVRDKFLAARKAVLGK